ncbi:MAG: hypothetical protein ACOCYQ_05950 [Alkalispirochaeta sp.]
MSARNLRWNLVFGGFLFILFAAVHLPAQYAVDVHNAIYDDLSLWEGAGYTRQPPLMRPYSEPVLKRMLQDVVARGDIASRAKAQEYLERLDGSLDVGVEVVQINRFRDDEYNGKGGLGLSMQGSFSDNLYYAGGISGWLLDAENDGLLPRYQRPIYDILEDNAKITVQGRDIDTLMQVLSGVTIGTERVALRGALSRSSFGPFHDDSVVISGDAPQTANFTFTFEHGPFRYEAALMSLRAQSLYQSIDSREEMEEATKIYQSSEDQDLAYYILDATSIYDKEGPGKYLHLQTYTYRPTDRLTFSIIESVVFGPVFQAGYLVPFKFLFVAQGLTSFADNSFLGIAAEYRPAPRVRVPFVLYVDDANFNSLVRFNFDTKMNLAGQTGVVWTPLRYGIQQIALDYTAITPYVYAHDGPGMYEPDFNYTNYVHGKTSLGSALEPNSDRIALRVKTRPVPRLGVNFVGRFIRHANASEGVLDGYGNDGSIYDDGRKYDFVEPDDDSTIAYYDQGGASYQNELRFLTQDTIEMTWQGGMDAEFLIPFDTGMLALQGDYLFEYIRDPIEYVWDADTLTGSTVANDDEVNHYFAIEVAYRY